MEDLIRAIKLAQPSTLVGSLPAADLCFASRAFHVRKLFPTIFFFLLDQSRTQHVASGQRRLGSVGVPRIIAIAVLNGFGMHTFDDLRGQILRSTRGQGFLTPQYSFALEQNFSRARLPGKHSCGQTAASGSGRSE